MPELSIGEHTLDADLVVFDKDGTLMDFHGVWGPRGLAAVAALRDDVPAAALAALHATLGVDPHTARVAGEGVLATEPMARIEEHCVRALCDHGVSPVLAARLIETRFSPCLRASPVPDTVRAIGDVAGLFDTLRGAGIACAVLTTDDRAATLTALDLLGLAGKVGELVCGDDDVPAKPAGDGIALIARRIGVRVARSVMIGDTAVDLRAGRAAGCACVVGVASGAGSAPALALLADLVVDSVHALEVARA